MSGVLGGAGPRPHPDGAGLPEAIPGIIQVKALLGDSLCTQIGFSNLHPGQRVRVVVPAEGPYRYLRELWEMSSLAVEVLPLSEAGSTTLEEELATRTRAAELLRAHGCQRLHLLPSEDFGIGDVEAFYRRFFRQVERNDEAFFHSFTAPESFDILPPEEAMEWAERFLDEQRIGDFVVVHNRDASWNQDRRKVGCHHSEDFWNGMRNHALEPLVEAALSVLPSNTAVVRIGRGDRALTPRPRYADTLPLQLSLGQQVALIRRCRAYFGGLSGPVTFPWLFRKPMLIVNNPLIGCTWSRPGVPMVSLEKRILKDGVSRSFAEVPLLEGGGAPARLNGELGYEVRENPRADLEEGIHRLVEMMRTGEPSHLIHSRGTFRAPEVLMREYLGRVLVPRHAAYTQAFMAYERAMLEGITALMAHVFQHHDPHGTVEMGIYGAGGIGQRLLSEFRRRAAWRYRFFDRAEQLWGGCLEGVRVEAPDALGIRPPELLILATAQDNSSLLEGFAAKGWRRGENFFHFEDQNHLGHRRVRFGAKACEPFHAKAAAYLEAQGVGAEGSP